MSTLLTAEQLRDIFNYNPDSGVFSWRQGRGPVKAGHVAGTVNARGYRYITINKRFYLAHRLAWLHFYGVWPEGEVDHKNQNKSDNKIENLRDVTHSQNMHNRPKYANNNSGFRGVSWNRSLALWRAEISVNKKKIHLGYFNTAESAYSAYTTAREERYQKQTQAITDEVAT